MNPQTVRQLNQLNQQFYQKTAESFAQSRQQPWAGWKELLPFIHKLQNKNSQQSHAAVKPIRVLDIAAGNGRFASFLSYSRIHYHYWGIDTSSKLLEKAHLHLNQLGVKFQLKELDLIESLQKNNFITQLQRWQFQDSQPTELSQQSKEVRQPKYNQQSRYELITAFGILHHIPTQELRFQFIENLASLLASHQSLLVVTAWQFGTDQRFQKKLVDPQTTGFDPQQLEKNDFFLGWKKVPGAYRYCHHLDESELSVMLKKLNNLKLKHNFLSDGRSDKLNRYLVFSPTTPTINSLP